MNETTNKTPKKKTMARQLAEHLKALYDDDNNRAALARLRRGLGKQPGDAMEMFSPLRRFLSNKPKPRSENAVFIVAALFAYYPQAKTDVGNLGASMRLLRDEERKKNPRAKADEKSNKIDGVEKRFIALLNAEAENLPDYLRQIIGLLKSKEIAVNWEQLFRDVRNWESVGDENRKGRNVQSKWAHSFWGSRNEQNKPETEENLEGEQQ